MDSMTLEPETPLPSVEHFSSPAAYNAAHPARAYPDPEQFERWETLFVDGVFDGPRSQLHVDFLPGGRIGTADEIGKVVTSSPSGRGAVEVELPDVTRAQAKALLLGFDPRPVTLEELRSALRASSIPRPPS